MPSTILSEYLAQPEVSTRSLAKLTGVSAATISNWSSGRKSVPTAKQMAQLLTAMGADSALRRQWWSAVFDCAEREVPQVVGFVVAVDQPVEQPESA